MVKRWLDSEVARLRDEKLLRVYALTGMRQAGKTTLARALFPEYPFFNFDDPLLRSEWQEKAGASFLTTQLPRAVLDEAQKFPALFDAIKAAVDADKSARYLLTGSTQFLLGHKIRESLAGRVRLLTLFPFAFGEITGVDRPLFSRLLDLGSRAEFVSILEDLRLRWSPASPEAVELNRLWRKFLTFGGMPPQVEATGLEEWREWLRNYVLTFLQRDIFDVARIREIENFSLVLKNLAFRAAKLSNLAAVASETRTSSPTVAAYLDILKVSFHVFSLPGFTANPRKALVKAPKVMFTDVGVLRALTGEWDHVYGDLFENAVASEIRKIIHILRPDYEMFHLRTKDRREIDLLLVRNGRAIAVEVKAGGEVRPGELGAFRGLEDILEMDVVAKVVLANGDAVRMIGDIGVLPAKVLLGS